MNTYLFLAIFVVISFAILVLGKALFHKDAIFTIAIGAVIAANIYNVDAYPIYIGDLLFGLDSIIYTIFVFCMLLMYIDYGKEATKTLLYTSLFSIFFTAFFAFMGSYSLNGGITTDMIWGALSYINSIVATFFAIWAMIFVYDFLRKRKVNWYFTVFIVLIVACIINSLLYFGLTLLFSGNLGDTFGIALAGSYIGKTVASAICLFIFFIDNISKKRRIRGAKKEI